MKQILLIGDSIRMGQNILTPEAFARLGAIIAEYLRGI